jgi:hypothetical protein
MRPDEPYCLYDEQGKGKRTILIGQRVRRIN